MGAGEFTGESMNSPVPYCSWVTPAAFGPSCDAPHHLTGTTALFRLRVADLTPSISGSPRTITTSSQLMNPHLIRVPGSSGVAKLAPYGQMSGFAINA